MRHWLPRVVLLFTSLLFAVAIIEVAFRVTAHHDPWYERLEEEQTGLFVPRQLVAGQPFKVREGLSDSPKPAASYRILFLGDSFTYGSGVQDATRVFPGLVTAKLNEMGSAPPRVRYEFFNGGIPGSLTPSWIKLLDATAAAYQPDLVVTVFFLRDGTQGIGGSRANIREVGKRMAALAEESWLFRRSHVYRYFRERQVQLEFSQDYMQAMHDAYLGGSGEIDEWQRAQQNLLRLRDETERRGAKFVLVIFPVLFALGSDYPLAEVCREIERFATQHGIPVVSLLPTFIGEHAPSLWVSPLDQHPNERAHALAADAIVAFVAPMTLDSPAP